MPIFFDTHCHLDDKIWDATPSLILKEAIKEGVQYLLVPATGGRTNFEKILALQKNHKALIAFGLHPLYADSFSTEDISILADFIIHHRPLAIGEIGLDKSVNAPDLTHQTILFEAQLSLAKQCHLPVILHTRHTIQHVLTSIRKIGSVGGIAHAFNGSLEEATQFIKLGFKLGFGSTVTYPRALNIRRLIQRLPSNALVLETDAPYMRAFGQKNPSKPSQIANYAKVIAALRDESVENIAKITAKNAFQVLCASKEDRISLSLHADS